MGEVLREPLKRGRPKSSKRGGKLTAEECRNVGTALRFLRTGLGLEWTELAERMGYQRDSLWNATTATPFASAALALATARVAEVDVTVILSGAWPPKNICPTCGRCG